MDLAQSNYSDICKSSMNQILYPIILGLVLGFLSLYAGFWNTGLLLVFIVALCLVVKKNGSAMAFLFFLAPYEFYGDLGSFVITSNETIILAILVGFLFRYHRGDKFNLRILVLFIPFIVMQILSLSCAVNIGSGLKQIIRWCEFFAVFFISVNLFKNYEDFKRAVCYMIYGAIPIAFYGIYQSLIGFGGFMSEIIPMTAEEMKLNMLFGTFIRAHSILVQANHLGAYLVLVIPLSFIAVYSSKSESEKSHFIKNSFLIKHFNKLSISLFMITIILTMSRSSWLALTVSYLILLVHFRFAHRNKSQNRMGLFSKPIIKMFAFILSASLLCVFMVFLIPQIKDRFASLGDLKEDLASNKRISFYKVGLNIIKDFPFIGVGIGNYTSISDRYAPVGMDPIGSKIHLHNLYLQIGVETGLLGLLAFLLFLGSVFAYILGFYIKSDTMSRHMIKIVLIASIAFLIQNTADIFFVKGIHFLWAGITGGAMGILSNRNTNNLPKGEIH
jgi:putative inorganic carbon (hco3(-)) transporter